jgi:tetratricopeptide (TPR) repeat protein
MHHTFTHPDGRPGESPGVNRYTPLRLVQSTVQTRRTAHKTTPVTRAILLTAILALPLLSPAQKKNIDSLKQALSRERVDSNRFHLLERLSFAYLWSDSDSSLQYARMGLALSRQLANPRYEATILVMFSHILTLSGNHQTAIKYAQKGLRISEQLGDPELTADAYTALADAYNELKDYRESLKYIYKCKEIYVATGDRKAMVGALTNLGINYNSLNQLDSALYYSQKAYEAAVAYGKWDVDMIGANLIRLGSVHGKMGNHDIGLAYLRKGIESSLYYEDWIDFYDGNLGIARIERELGRLDSSRKYARLAYASAERIDNRRGMLDAAELLTALYRGSDKDSTLHYLELQASLKDSLFSEEKIRAVQSMTYNENEYQREMEEQRRREAQERQDNLKMFGITIFIMTLFVTLVVLSRIRTHPRLIGFLGLVSLLLLFEFIALLLHPLIGRLTHHNPVLMLLSMVSIATVLVPAHHRLEHWIKHKLAGKREEAVRA